MWDRVGKPAPEVPVKSLFLASLPVALVAALLAGAPRTQAATGPSIEELEQLTAARVDARVQVHLAQLAVGVRAAE